MRILARLAIVAVLGCLMAVLLQHAHATQSGAGSDPSKMVFYYLGIVGLGVVIGIMVATSLLPVLGDLVGGYFYNPATEVEKNPHQKALAKMANGEFQEAAVEYNRVLEKNPTDTLAISEIVRIYCDKLHQPEPAAALLEQSLAQEHWTNDQVAFLGERLVDVYWLHEHDATRARAILLQLAELMPETKHAANALHRLHEIDRAAA